MNSFGNIFRVSIFGESHGSAIGITIDGCPPGVDFIESDMESDIKRRMPGAAGTTPRKEADTPEILSGTYNGKTTGAPVTVIFRNSNTLDYNWQFFGSGKSRVLKWSVKGAVLSDSQKLEIQSIFDTKLGVGKAEVL